MRRRCGFGKAEGEVNSSSFVVMIKSASIHYYFATKGELGAALANRYAAYYAEYFEGLLAEGLDPETCLSRYTDVFADTLRNENRMCLAGILSAERNELPDDVRTEVVKWGEMNERWIARVLAMRNSGKPEEIRRRARAIFAAVSGAADRSQPRRRLRL